MFITPSTDLSNNVFDNELIEPMIFDVLPDVKSRGEPLQEPMEFFEPSPQNNINEYETLVSPMDFFDEAQINCTQFIVT